MHPALCCSSCNIQLETPYCNNCKKLIEFSPEVDYYSLFHLERKLIISKELLLKNYYHLSVILHPDGFYGTEERKLATAWMELTNLAYETLNNEEKRILYFLNKKTEDMKAIDSTVNVIDIYGDIQTALMNADELLNKAPAMQTRITLLKYNYELKKVESALADLNEKIRIIREQWTNRLQEFDNRPLTDNDVETLLNIAGTFSYIHKFDNLINEKILQLKKVMKNI